MSRCSTRVGHYDARLGHYDARMRKQIADLDEGDKWKEASLKAASQTTGYGSNVHVPPNLLMLDKQRSSVKKWKAQVGVKGW